jgi:hypothetical protein
MTMHISHVYDNLCLRDPRHPDYSWLWEDDDAVPIPRQNCSCDNCHYGRDPLAVYILGLPEEPVPVQGETP